MSALRTVALVGVAVPLLWGCAPSLSSQLQTARMQYLNRVSGLEASHRSLLVHFGALEKEAKAFRSSLSDAQAELLNRAITLQTDTSQQAFLQSLIPAQRDRLKWFAEWNETLQAQRERLLRAVSTLQRDAMHIQNLETQVAEQRAFSDQLFAVGLVLTQAGQYQQQQRQQAHQQAQLTFQQMQMNQQLELMNQQLQTIQQQQRASCVRRAMQSRVPTFCP